MSSAGMARQGYELQLTRYDEHEARQNAGARMSAVRSGEAEPEEGNRTLVNA